MTTLAEVRERPAERTGGRWLMLTVLLAGQFMAFATALVWVAVLLGFGVLAALALTRTVVRST